MLYNKYFYGLSQEILYFVSHPFLSQPMHLRYEWCSQRLRENPFQGLFVCLSICLSVDLSLCALEFHLLSHKARAQQSQ